MTSIFGIEFHGTRTNRESEYDPTSIAPCLRRGWPQVVHAWIAQCHATVIGRSNNSQSKRLKEFCPNKARIDHHDCTPGTSTPKEHGKLPRIIQRRTCPICNRYLWTSKRHSLEFRCGTAGLLIPWPKKVYLTKQIPSPPCVTERYLNDGESRGRAHSSPTEHRSLNAHHLSSLPSSFQVSTWTTATSTTPTLTTPTLATRFPQPMGGYTSTHS